MKGIYFEEKGEMLLEHIGMTKAEFARRMGIQRQNVNVLFKTNNLETIARAADILEVPLALLLSFVDEPDISNTSIIDSVDEGLNTVSSVILPEDVPMGVRQRIEGYVAG